MIHLQDIQIKDLSFTPHILSDEILGRVQELAIQINNDYERKNPIFISVLTGAFMFTSDLMKQINIQSELKFIEVKSYEGLKSTGVIKDNFDFGQWVNDRHIIFIEDIVDTGHTMNHLLNKINKYDPASVEIVSLFLKKSCLEYDINVRYTGFSIPKIFIVGYGLDYDGQGRNYQDVYHLKD